MKTNPALKIVCCVTGLIFSLFRIGNCQSVTTPIPQSLGSVPVQESLATSQATEIPVPELPLFGHNLFTASEEFLSRLPAGGVMFPATYRLGPGDRLGIFLLGKIQQNFDVVINVEGKIFIPNVGVLYVANLTISECNVLLEKKLAKYYDNFSVSLMLIEPKKVPIMVVGDVNRPGKYFLSSLNTVLDAVIMAGGPTDIGSLRNIQIYRQDKLLATADLYGFLMTGDFQNDAFLQQHDKIVIPLMNAVISISGEIKRQARFELKAGGNERLSDLIYLAGGFTELAYLDKIEISRLLADGERSVFYVNYKKILENDSCASNTELKHDDKINVYSKIEQNYPRYVYVHGEVKKP
ncbi:MAG TPA: SLBB domain-containing protein, partial [bacterium]